MRNPAGYTRFPATSVAKIAYSVEVTLFHNISNKETSFYKQAWQICFFTADLCEQ